MHKAIAFILFVFLAAFSQAKPTPVPKQTKTIPAKTPVECLPIGETNWGLLSVDGGDFSFKGHPDWDGFGEIKRKKDGSPYCLVTWVLLSDGRRGYGVYFFSDDKMIGRWGYVNEVFIDDDGGISDNAHTDSIHKK